jgi:hypothetical protein
MNSYRRVVFFGYRDYLGNVPVILRIVSCTGVSTTRYLLLHGNQKHSFTELIPNSAIFGRVRYGMRAMLWDDWRVRYAIVSDPANPSPTFITLLSALLAA